MTHGDEQTPPDPATDPPAEPQPLCRQTRPDHGPLPLWVRLGLLFIGWVLAGIGILGLALPGIQGVLTLLFAAAMLSAASETVYRLMRRLLERWPTIWTRIDRFRDRLHDRFSRRE